MREIIFRGKLVKDSDSFKTYKKGVVITGGFYKEVVKTYIVAHSNIFEVEPESVEQYAGVKDCNGLMLFDGDILTDGVNRHRIFYLESEASFKLEILKSNALMEYCGLHQSWINTYKKALEEKKEEKANTLEPSN
jgi:hypothetical protein